MSWETPTIEDITVEELSVEADMLPQAFVSWFNTPEKLEYIGHYLSEDSSAVEGIEDRNGQKGTFREAFKNKEMVLCRVKEGELIVVYRLEDSSWRPPSPGEKRFPARWWTPYSYSTDGSNTRSKIAVLPQWNSLKRPRILFLTPGTIIYAGRAAPQGDERAGRLSGGAVQFLIPKYCGEDLESHTILMLQKMNMMEYFIKEPPNSSWGDYDFIKSYTNIIRNDRVARDSHGNCISKFGGYFADCLKEHYHYKAKDVSSRRAEQIMKQHCFLEGEYAKIGSSSYLATLPYKIRSLLESGVEELRWNIRCDFKVSTPYHTFDMQRSITHPYRTHVTEHGRCITGG